MRTEWLAAALLLAAFAPASEAAAAEGRKLALVVNGDSETRHLGNVERALEVLELDGWLRFVVSPEAPAAGAEVHVDGDLGGLQSIVEQLKEELTSADELLIYTTGHGDKEGDQPTLCLKSDGYLYEEVWALLDINEGRRRTVVMDQCYSGDWAPVFNDDPATLFISTGNDDEKTSCGEWSPLFWSGAEHVADRDRDGVISWRERFGHAVDKGLLTTSPRLLATSGHRSPASTPFEATVRSFPAGDGEDPEVWLTEQLARLSPGQFALVQRCDEAIKCAADGLSLDALAKQIAGEHLVLSGPAATETSGIRIYDSHGFFREVWDLDSVEQQLHDWNLTGAERMQLVGRHLDDDSLPTRARALRRYARLAGRLKPAELELRQGAVVRMEAALADRLAPLQAAGIDAAADLGPHLEPEVAARVADRVAALLQSEAKAPSAAAVRALKTLAVHLEPARGRETAPLLRGFFDHDRKSLRAAAIAGWATLADDLEEAELRAGALVIRPLMDHDSRRLAVAALRAFGSLGRGLTDRDLALGLLALQEALAGDDVQRSEGGLTGVRMLAEGGFVPPQRATELEALLRPAMRAGSEPSEEALTWAYLVPLVQGDAELEIAAVIEELESATTAEHRRRAAFVLGRLPLQSAAKERKHRLERLRALARDETELVRQAARSSLHELLPQLPMAQRRALTRFLEQ